MPNATGRAGFACADLTTFCRLDDLERFVTQAAALRGARLAPTEAAWALGLDGGLSGGLNGGLSGLAVQTTTYAAAVATDARTKARLQGYEGDPCGECGNFTLVRNGTCMKCDNCGTTTGC